MDDIALNNIFTAVKDRVIDKVDSLNGLGVLNNRISFEGWLKVEAINAISQQIDRVQNRGSDLKLIDGSKIELKASMDDLHKGNFYRQENGKYVGRYVDPVLIIAGGNIDRLNEYASKYKMLVLNSYALNNSLIIALVRQETVDNGIEGDGKMPSCLMPNVRHS